MKPGMYAAACAVTGVAALAGFCAGIVLGVRDTKATVDRAGAAFIDWIADGLDSWSGDDDA